MPADLPPTSEYTYCVELSIDEVDARDDIAAGAPITFSKPLPYYVENLAQWPVGYVVPVGSYDTEQGIWLPSKDGRVIEVLGDLDNDDLAELVVDTSGNPASEEALDALGIDDVERANLLSLYSPGQSIWRAQLPHFSAHDLNGYPNLVTGNGGGNGGDGTGGGPNSRYPNIGNGGDSNSPGTPKSDCDESGSIIRCQKQGLGEMIPITGTPHHLVYDSTRSAGYDENTVTVMLQGDDPIPDGVVRIFVEMEIAGTLESVSFEVEEAPEYHVFSWNGLDAYGRKLNGAQHANISLGYGYQATWSVYEPEAYESDESFAAFIYSTGDEAVIAAWEGYTVVEWQTWDVQLGKLEISSEQLGGWTLSNHHAYDPFAGRLWLGNGEISESESSVYTIDEFAGEPRPEDFFCFWETQSRDGQVADDVCISPEHIFADALGNFWFSELDPRPQIWRIDSSGILHHVGGIYQTTHETGLDNVLATETDLSAPHGLAVDNSGNLFFAESGTSRIRQIDTDGVLTTVAGGTSNQRQPALVEDENTWLQVSAGERHSCAVRTNGSLACWGYNSDGQLGNGSAGSGNDWISPTDVPGMDWQKVVTGLTFTCGLKSNQELWCWGRNQYIGLEGTGRTTSPYQFMAGTLFSDVTAGDRFGCALTNSGDAWCWGNGSYGQLGDGASSTSTLPVQVSGGLVFSSIEAGASHACGIVVGSQAQERNLWCWGDGTYGQLGIGIEGEERAEPVQVEADETDAKDWEAIYLGAEHTCGLRGIQGSAHQLWCWGANTGGQLGTDNTSLYSLPEQIDAVSGIGWVSLSLGGGDGYSDVGDENAHSCGIKEDGKTYCWGRNTYGRVGQTTINAEYLAPIQIDGDPGFQSLALGDNHNCGITSAGALYCWGLNEDGQLGIGIMGTTGYFGNGSAATGALLSQPTDVALDDWGNIFIVDSGNNRIRHISPNGTIHTIAGNGEFAIEVANGTPALEAGLGYLDSIAVDFNGDIYFGGRRHLYKMGTDGIIYNYAGNGDCSSGEENHSSLATEAGICDVRGIVVDTNGQVFFADAGSGVDSLIYMVANDGLLYRVAGGGSDLEEANGGPAWDALLNSIEDVAIDPNGDIYIPENYPDRWIRRVTNPFPGFTNADNLLIASPDGTEVYEFSSAGKHLSTYASNTGAALYFFEYDQANEDLLVSVIDSYGKTLIIERDAATNAPTALVAPFGQQTELTVDASGFLSNVINPAGYQWTLNYNEDDSGLLANYTSPSGGTSSFTYDERGRLILDEGPDGYTVSLERIDENDSYTVTVSNSGGRTTTYSNFRTSSGGTQRTTTSSLYGITTFVDHDDGNGTVTYSDGTTIEIELAPDPVWGDQASYVSSYILTTPVGRTLSYTNTKTATLSDSNDPLSIISQSETMNLPGGTYTSYWNTDARTLTETMLDGQTKVTSLNTAGQLIEVEWPYSGVPTRSVVRRSDGLIETISQGSYDIVYTYNEIGEMQSRAVGDSTFEYAYDSDGLITGITTPSTNYFAAEFNMADLEYVVTMPNAADHSYSFAANGQPISYVAPGDTDGITIDYSDDFLLEQITYPTGNSFNQFYDSNGRLDGWSFPEADIDVGYVGNAYYPTSLTRTPSSSDNNQSIVFDWDGPLLQRIDFSGVANGSFIYDFNEAFSVSKITLETSGETFAYDLFYNGNGSPTSFGPFTILRNPESDLEEGATDGTASISIEYDADQRVAGKALSISASALYTLSLGYGQSRQVEERTETVNGTSTFCRYTYDDDGQLREVQKGPNESNLSVVESYTYDDHGNRLTHQREGQNIVTMTHDLKDQISTIDGSSLTYDENGALIAKGSDSFTYSLRGELLSATVGGVTVDYHYDGLGRRVGRTADGNTTQYLYGVHSNGILPSHVILPSGVVVILYYDSRGQLYAMDKEETMYYVGADQVGTPRVLTNAAGMVVYEAEYDSFGVPLSLSSSLGFDLPIGFAGGLVDADTGLVLFGLRDYDPDLGRFTRRDPALFHNTQPNLHIYVANDPVNFRDPSGLWKADFSAYSGLGGGAEFAYKDGHASVCFEVGFGTPSVGVGGDLFADAATDSEVVGGEVSGGCGPVGVKGKIELDNCGRLTVEASASSGPFEVSQKGELSFNQNWDSTITNDSSADVKVSKEFVPEPESSGIHPGMGCSSPGAKVYAKVCRRLW
jgi:RHS repeat-associated protein